MNLLPVYKKSNSTISQQILNSEYYEKKQTHALFSNTRKKHSITWKSQIVRFELTWTNDFVISRSEI